MHLTRADCERLGIDWETGRTTGGGAQAREAIRPVSAASHSVHVQDMDLTRGRECVTIGDQVPGRAILPEGPPGRWVLEIPGWRPALDNALVGRHPMVVHRLKTRDARAVHAACLAAGVTRPAGGRRVRLTVYYPCGRFPDGPAPLKSFHDALTRAGAIVDDSDRWLDWSKPAFERGPKGTRIVVEDV